MNQFRRYLPEAIAFGLCGIYLCLTYNYPFFWDSILLTSKQAHFFWENGFRYFWLTYELDSGHPPFMGMYMAVWWFILGRELWVSHLSLTPFIFIYLVYSWRLLIRYINADKSIVLFGGLIVAIDPLFLSQSTIMSPDMVLMAAFVGCLFGYNTGNKLILAVFSMFLGLVSMRGAIVLAGFGLFHISNYLFVRKLSFTQMWRTGWPMIPGALMFVLFLIGHWFHSGWIGFSESSPWSGSFRFASIIEIFKNSAVFTWRLIDHGRMFLWLVIALALWRNRFHISQQWKTGILLFSILTFIILVNTVFYKYLTATRYFWPLLWMVTMGAVIAGASLKRTLRYLLLTLVLVMFICSHIWKYPSIVAQDWEATLIHLPFDELMTSAETEINSRSIDINSVGTAFPAKNSKYHTHLSDSVTWTYAPFKPQNNSYILWNTVMNDLRPYKVQIESNYKAVWENEKGKLKVVLYCKVESE